MRTYIFALLLTAGCDGSLQGNPLGEHPADVDADVHCGCGPESFEPAVIDLQWSVSAMHGVHLNPDRLGFGRPVTCEDVAVKLNDLSAEVRAYVEQLGDE